MTTNSYHAFIKKLLEDKQAKNPKYSVRALARDIGIDSGDLVNILNNKKKVTTRIAYKIGTYLEMNEKELLEFIKPTLVE